MRNNLTSCFYSFFLITRVAESGLFADFISVRQGGTVRPGVMEEKERYSRFAQLFPFFQNVGSFSAIDPYLKFKVLEICIIYNFAAILLMRSIVDICKPTVKRRGKKGYQCRILCSQNIFCHPAHNR